MWPQAAPARERSVGQVPAQGMASRGPGQAGRATGQSEEEQKWQGSACSFPPHRWGTGPGRWGSPQVGERWGPSGANAWPTSSTLTPSLQKGFWLYCPVRPRGLALQPLPLHTPHAAGAGDPAPGSWLCSLKTQGPVLGPDPGLTARAGAHSAWNPCRPGRPGAAGCQAQYRGAHREPRGGPSTLLSVCQAPWLRACLEQDYSVRPAWPKGLGVQQGLGWRLWLPSQHCPLTFTRWPESVLTAHGLFAPAHQLCGPPDLSLLLSHQGDPHPQGLLSPPPSGRAWPPSQCREPLRHSPGWGVQAGSPGPRLNFRFHR